MNNKKIAWFSIAAAAGTVVFALATSRPYSAPPSGLRDAVASAYEEAESPASGAAFRTAAVPPPAEVSGRTAAEASGLTSLISAWLEVKERMSAAELSLYAIESMDKRYDERTYRNALAELNDCHKAALALNAGAEKALAGTPRDRNTLAAARLLLSDISEATGDGDIPPPVMRCLYNIGRISPELKRRTRPHNDTLSMIMDELGKAGRKIMKFSGPL